MLLASELVILKLILRVVLYSRTENGCRQITLKFTASDTASVLVHHSMCSSYPLHWESGFRVWVWVGLSGGCKARLNR